VDPAREEFHLGDEPHPARREEHQQVRQGLKKEENVDHPQVNHIRLMLDS
jgi:hypothetical protein